MPLISLQYLRAIAALMVVLLHVGTQINRFGFVDAIPSWLAHGVDIFFVLSGFLMWSTTVGRNQGPLEFYRRRIVRIVPLYWMLTSVVVLVMLVAPRLLQTVRFDLFNVIGSYLFFFSHSSNGSLEPVLVVGWTLNYEMLFYLIYGAALLLPGAYSFVATAVVISALVAVGSIVANPGPLTQAYTSSIMLEFVFGMAVAYWWKGSRGARCPAWLAVVVLVIGFAGLSGGLGLNLSRATDTGIPATMVIVGALLLERSGKVPAWPALRWLGDISYSLYLVHPIALSAISQAWRGLGLHASAVGAGSFVFVAVAFCVAVAALVYYLFELPLTRRLGARTGARVSGPRTA
ncbi:acyltransferase [Xylophilus sp. GOD-11R]|uniref:acyltransferase family protein n=1 Tax=Xylophilus sp. GOD-11R TaxID=3089814 RepID=UPI00298D0BCE|nr:acyltransferase [Xylophilus sp. GOD-11R]WPB54949.1 acyltransferase [Xylophilus sp. GOD-11R]